jgi:transcriptional regulator of NAD metabolism
MDRVGDRIRVAGRWEGEQQHVTVSYPISTGRLPAGRLHLANPEDREKWCREMQRSFPDLILIHRD